MVAAKCRHREGPALSARVFALLQRVDPLKPLNGPLQRDTPPPEEPLVEGAVLAPTAAQRRTPPAASKTKESRKPAVTLAT